MTATLFRGLWRRNFTAVEERAILCDARTRIISLAQLPSFDSQGQLRGLLIYVTAHVCGARDKDLRRDHLECLFRLFLHGRISNPKRGTIIRIDLSDLE